MVELVPLKKRIGVEARGVDVNALSEADFEAIYDAWIGAAILLIRGQSMTPDQQMTLTSRFGERASYTRPQFSPSDAPEMLVLSNIEENGKLIGSPVSGRVWHTDGHYLERPPAGSLLYAMITPPEGGDTMFANQIEAYADLPDCVKRRIEGRQVIISRIQSRPYNYPDRPPPTEAEHAEWTDVTHPIVRTHPVSGRKALYTGGNVPWRIPGMDVAESVPLVTFLQEFSVTARYVYRHRWEPGDIIVWDNRSALHKASWFDADRYRRLMYRSTFGERRH